MSQENGLPEAKLFDRGFINQTFEDSSGVVVKRFIDQNKSVYVEAKARYSAEKAALQELGGTIAPALLGFNDDQHVLYMERLEGENAQALIEQGLTPDQEKTLYLGMGLLLLCLHRHAVELEPVEYVTRLEHKAYADFEIFQRSGYLSTATDDGDEIPEILRKYVLPAAQDIIVMYPRLVRTHGDWWSNNVIAKLAGDSVEVKGLIDLEFSTPGVSEEDLAQICLWEFEKRPWAKPLFEAGYGKVDLELVNPFMFLKLMDFLEGCNSQAWQAENGNPDGFLHQTVRQLRSQLVRYR